MFITTSSSSMQFFSFFDVLPSAPTTTGMTLMILKFHILLISLFSSCISQFLLSLFANSYVCRYSNINYGKTSLILIHYNYIWFPCLDFSFTLDHNLKIFTSSFLKTPFLTSFQVAFPTQFLMNYSWNIIVPSLVLILCQLFTFLHNMRYCLSHILQSGDWAVLSILCFT